MTKKIMRILLAGGGTLGSVNPLIAIYEEAQKQGKNWEWFWVGTKSGPERALVQSLGIKCTTLPTAKLRRYWSALNFFVPFILLFAFIKSLILMFKIRPQAVITAGSFIGVPIVWSAWVWRIISPPLRGGVRGGGRGRKPTPFIVVHQQDIRPGLANKLCAPFSDKITVAFEKSLADYPSGKAEWIGNPMREWIGQGRRDEANRLWGLDKNYPTLLIMGGSSGARALNEWAWRNLPQLTEFANIIHLTGVGKTNKAVSSPFKGEGRACPVLDTGVRVGGTRYHQLEFLKDNLSHALAAADLVVSRAGLATLSELSYLGKAAILIPLADTHQEENAEYFAEHHAAVVFKQNELDERAVEKIKALLASPAERAILGESIKKIIKAKGRERIIEIIEEISNCSKQ